MVTDSFEEKMCKWQYHIMKHTAWIMRQYGYAVEDTINYVEFRKQFYSKISEQ
jgi:hypothetical protein